MARYYWCVMHLDGSTHSGAGKTLEAAITSCQEWKLSQTADLTIISVTFVNTQPDDEADKLESKTR